MSENTTSNRPTHSVYVLIERGQDKEPFRRDLGSAWPHKDGKGFSISLDAVPLTGRLHIREIQQKESEGQ